MESHQSLSITPLSLNRLSSTVLKGQSLVFDMPKIILVSMSLYEPKSLSFDHERYSVTYMDIFAVSIIVWFTGIVGIRIIVAVFYFCKPNHNDDNYPVVV